MAAPPATSQSLLDLHEPRRPVKVTKSKWTTGRVTHRENTGQQTISSTEMYYQTAALKQLPVVEALSV